MPSSPVCHSPKPSSNIHIVVDNSNLFIGSQMGQGKNQLQDASVRINVANLARIIEDNKRIQNIRTRIVGGSTPPRNAKVWIEWEKSQYKCLLGERSMSNKEVFLDDMLHAQIQYLILKNKVNQQNAQHLILISGDGNGNDNRTSFPDVISLALEYKWTVEVWSWKASLSSKFLDIQRKYPSKMTINHLDTYRSKFTFKQKQQQYNNNNNNNQFSTKSIVGFVIGLIIVVYFFHIL